MATEPIGYWIEVAKRAYADDGDPRALAYATDLVVRQEQEPPGAVMDTSSLPPWLRNLWLDRYWLGKDGYPAVNDKVTW